MPQYFIALLLCLAGLSAHAQGASQDENSEIKFTELELEKNIPRNETPQVPIAPVTTKQLDTVNLAPVRSEIGDSQVVVIQKNYMPKTGRFALNGGLTLFPSDVFFKTFGLQARGSYFFNETWGAELNAIMFNSSRTSELDDLENKQRVSVSNLATLKSYLGAQVYFSSMYGKYAWMDRRILPFEIYQTVGLGNVSTDKSSNPALSVGLGQMISMSRDSAIRLDLTFLFYQSENVAGSKSSQSSLLINFSYSAIFPSVGRRW